MPMITFSNFLPHLGNQIELHILILKVGSKWDERLQSLNMSISFLSLETLYVEGYLGMNWGRLATQRMIPSMVVDLLMQNKINYVKLFSASDNVLEAFSATDIGLEITMPNQSTQKMKTQADVDEWVVQIIVSHPNVHFMYVFL